jgi:hypothetical protein
LAALEKGARVIAIDTEPRHLSSLWYHAHPKLRLRLELRCGNFPEEISFNPKFIRKSTNPKETNVARNFPWRRFFVF